MQELVNVKILESHRLSKSDRRRPTASSIGMPGDVDLIWHDINEQ